MCECDKYVKFTIARIALFQLFFKAEVSELRWAGKSEAIDELVNTYLGQGK